MENYKVHVTYVNGETEIIEFNTPNLSWSMDQYQRNRDFLTWEVVEEEENDIEDIQLEKDIKNGLYGEEY
tara:strand:- start:9019 stop:9228 length:210 start_codon:yes stop_codon:yes gene_type:complete